MGWLPFRKNGRQGGANAATDWSNSWNYVFRFPEGLYENPFQRRIHHLQSRNPNVEFRLELDKGGFYMLESKNVEIPKEELIHVGLTGTWK
jgi:hypothetical protein